MNIQDFKKAKQELEDNILKLVSSFENETEAKVTDVFLHTKEQKVTKVSVRVIF